MNRARTALLALLLGAAPPALAQTVSLSPSVVQLSGTAGQSTTQSLTMHNATPMDLAFDLEAQDVIVRDGKREFVRAGELQGSIAATAVFSPRTVTVPAGGDRSVSVTMTLVPAARHRAVVALFRGTTRIMQGSAGATVSLGTLFTFTLSDHVSIAPLALTVTPPSATRNAAFELPLENDGSEPLVPKGMAVVLDAAGTIVGRAPFDPVRLLPGERVTLRTEYPGELRQGTYRVLSTIEVAGKPLTQSAELAVP